jgi:hypothetical protein
MKKGKTWRQIYAPMIAQIIKENDGKSVNELKKILQAANPGQYKHMKKTWANEYMIQLGLSKNKVKHHPTKPYELPSLFKDNY